MKSIPLLWLLEYERTRAVLSDTSDDFPSILYSIDPLPTRTIFTQLLGDLPLVC